MSVCPHTGWETWPAGFRWGRQEKLADAQSQDQGVLGPALRHLGFAWKGRALGGLSSPSPRIASKPAAPQPSHHPPDPPHLTLSPLASIRQYELVVHTDIDVAKVYMGEMGRLKSYENQKP